MAARIDRPDHFADHEPGHRQAFGELEFWFALIKVIAILALTAIGLFMIFKGFSTHSGTAAFHNLWSHGGMFPNGLHGFLLSFQMVVFAFVGIELVGLTAGKRKIPKRSFLKRSTISPFGFCFLYRCAPCNHEHLSVECHQS